MKKLFLLSLWVTIGLVAYSQSFEKPIVIPGKGVATPEGTHMQRIDRGSGLVPVKLHDQPQPIAAPTLVTQGENGIVKDARNLPLSATGKLMSVDEQEVDFEIPYNPNDPGICATPSPVVSLALTNSPTANCPIVVPCDLAANRDASIPTAGQPIKYFKLRWVIVRDASGLPSTNIDQVRVDQLMAEVNNDFLPWRIQFCADPANFVTDGTHYSLNAGSEDATLKNTHGSQPTTTINIYVVGNITNPGAGGYARFPFDPLGGYNIRGGVVLARSNMFLGTHTLAHELGHTFGLFHTFRGVDEVPACSNCYEDMGLAGQDTEGDWCSDTRPHPTNANICASQGTDGCSGIPFTGSPVNNHMSYSFCTTQFTPQQAGRMHCMIDTYLQNWVNFGGSTCGNLPPVADFSGTPTFWQAPMTVAYTDLSVPAQTITTWTWNFDVAGIGGVTPATWTGGPGVGNMPPPVTYTICDTSYTVRLTVTNGNGSDTETKVNYVRAACPAGDCDTLTQHWDTPVSAPTFYTFGANNFVTGLPSATLQGAGSTAWIGYYERYITPNPGVTTVGAIRVGLGNYLDPDSNMTFQAVLYNCTAAGVPIGPPITGFGGVNPGADLGVPAGGFFNEFWIPFNHATVTSANFLVGIEVFPGNAADRMILVSSTNGQGQNLGLNHVDANAGYLNYRTNIGLNFDLDIIPMLGPWKTEFFITGLGSVRTCDTTLVVITDSALFHTGMTSVEVRSAKLGSITGSTLADVDTLYLLYTGPGPDTLTFFTVNICGRADTVSYILSYPFDTTPGPVDFTKTQPNPICANTVVNFTGTPTGGANYLWDFGDGVVASSGASNTTAHVYTTPGLYYVTLTVTNASTCSANTTKLDYVEVVDCSVNAPIAGFNAQPDTLCLGSIFTFTDMSQAVPDAATNWFWAFDDGTFSLNQNPTHVYSVPGTYNVMLVASNAGGSDTVFFPVVVLGLPCTLPIDIRLDATEVEGAAVLGWETPADNVRMDFEVERGYDGQQFSKIGRVDWDEAHAPRLYSFIDPSPGAAGTVYYRLRELGHDGEVSYSNIASVEIGEQGNWINVYPNPATRGNALVVDAFLKDADRLRLSLYDVLGRKVWEGDLEAIAGMNRLDVATAGLAPGNYVLHVQTSKARTSKKIILQ